MRVRIEECQKYSRFLAGQVNDHRRIFAVLAPNPGFGDVISVVEMKGELVLVARGRRWEVCSTFELKNEFLWIGRRGNGSHARLIVGGAIVDESDGISVDVIKGDHLFHIGHGKRFHDSGVRHNQFES